MFWLIIFIINSTFYSLTFFLISLFLLHFCCCLFSSFCSIFFYFTFFLSPVSCCSIGIFIFLPFTIVSVFITTFMLLGYIITSLCSYFPSLVSNIYCLSFNLSVSCQDLFFRLSFLCNYRIQCYFFCGILTVCVSVGFLSLQRISGSCCVLTLLHVLPCGLRSLTLVFVSHSTIYISFHLSVRTRWVTQSCNYVWETTNAVGPFERSKGSSS